MQEIKKNKMCYFYNLKKIYNKIRKLLENFINIIE